MQEVIAELMAQMVRQQDLCSLCGMVLRLRNDWQTISCIDPAGRDLSYAGHIFADVSATDRTLKMACICRLDC